MIRSLEQALARLGNRTSIAELLLEEAARTYGGDHGFLLELEETTGGLRELARFGEIEQMLEQDMRIFAQYAADHPGEEESLLIAPDAEVVQKLSARKSVRRGMTHGVIVFPLTDGDRAMGAIYLGESEIGLLHAESANASELMKVGAMFGRVLGTERKFEQLQRQNEAFQLELKKDKDLGQLVGRSAAIDRVRKALALVGDMDVPLTLIGEPGSGVVLAAEAVHGVGAEKKGRFVQLPLGNLSESLAMELIFGAEPGAGKTVRGRRGAIRDAKNGTLLLQGVENLPLAIQERLVQAMNTGEALTVGGDAPYPVRARFIFSTETDLRSQEGAGKLTREFYLKLNLYPVILPPLRDRTEDLPDLVEHYVELASRTFNKTISSVDSEVYDHLGTYDWPENLKELEKEIRQAVLRTPDQGVLTTGALSQGLVGKPQTMTADSGEGTLKQRVARVEKRMIIDALEKNKHNQSITADQLGLSRQALINKLQRYGIETGRAFKRKQREIAKKAEK